MSNEQFKKNNEILKHIDEYKYNGMHFHFQGLYVFTEEQIINLLNEINTLLKEENEALKMEIAGMEAAIKTTGKTVRKEQNNEY